ncbi:MAG: 50S ribosomal protein L32 [Deltaproteobacteria bacterium]|nr:50S ribosomal protein L32 [Deltaproteobacteria bacterium]
MAVPKRKKSQARRDMRRAHNEKIKERSLSECPQCKQPKLPHRVCISCGFYKGREIIKQAV